MKIIKIFIAADKKLFESDLRELEGFFLRLNNCYVKKSLYFSPVLSGDIFDVQSLRRELAESSAAFILTGQGAKPGSGNPSGGESGGGNPSGGNASGAMSGIYKAILNCYSEGGNLKIFVYIRDDAGDVEIESNSTGGVDAGSVELEGSGATRRSGHEILSDPGLGIQSFYQSSYSHIDTLKFGILMQINHLGIDGVNIELDGGKVRQGSEVLMTLDCVEALTGYENLRDLKKKRAELESTFYAAKARYAETPDDSSAYDAYFKASVKRGKAMQEVRDIEAQLYNMIEGMYEHTAQGKLSARQAEAYKLIERGLLAEAREVLDISSIISESRRDDELVGQAAKRAQVHINEYIQLINVNRSLGDWAGVDACYREAAALEQRYDLCGSATLDYIEFLQKQNRFEDALEAAAKLEYCYDNKDDCQKADKWRLLSMTGSLCIALHRMPEVKKALGTVRDEMEQSGGAANQILLAEVYHLLGKLYCETRQPEQAEPMFRAVLKIWTGLAESDPDAHETNLSAAYHTLCDLYRETQRIEEAEQMGKSALEILERVYDREPEKADKLLAETYGNLGVLYDETDRFDQAHTMFEKSLEIKLKLAAENPEAYEPTLSNTYNSLGIVLANTKHFTLAEEMHKHAITIRKRLAAREPEAYERRLANSYNSLGALYHYCHRFVESEARFKDSLEIYKRLVLDNPETYEIYLTDNYTNLGSVYQELERFDEAEEMFMTGRAILERLAGQHPEAYEADLADTIFNMGGLYSKALRKKEAEKAYKDAYKLYKKYASGNPYCLRQLSETQKQLDSLTDIPGAQAGAFYRFTQDEKEVALLLTDGLSQREIARKLGITTLEAARMVSAIREKVSGKTGIDPVIEAITNEYKLTRREAEMLRYLRDSAGTDVIAAELFLSPETVKIHVRNLLKKLNVENRHTIADWLEKQA